ncbi:MAG: DUF4234 domain-containing protein [Anaerorhabdus sp.]
MIKKTDIVTCVLLSVFTCGLYQLFWIFSITEDVAKLGKDSSNRNGLMVVVLGIVTCGLYYLYWVYVTSRDLYDLELEQGIRATDNSVLNVILGIFTVMIIPLVFMQQSINRIIDEEI